VVAAAAEGVVEEDVAVEAVEVVADTVVEEEATEDPEPTAMVAVVEVEVTVVRGGKTALGALIFPTDSLLQL
jgi:hypothetical protein